MEELEKILRDYDLLYYYNIIKERNPSNNKPYHNLYHLLCVTEFCYIIGKSENLDDTEIRTLMLSGLFHDFGHYSSDDSENIKKSIEFFKEYSKENVVTEKNVLKNIKSTQYPYVIPDEDLNISQKIIRDSDLLQWTKDNFIEQVVIGLYKEFGVTDKKIAVEKQRNFMKNYLNFYTNKANEIYRDKIDEKLKELDEYENNL